MTEKYTVHIGAVANALVRQGIQTERGNINREIIRHNMMLEQAKTMLEQAKQEVRSIRYQNMFNTIHSAKNEVVEMIAKVAGRKAYAEVISYNKKNIEREL